MSKKISLRTLFANKRFVLFFSLAIAVIIWFLVSIQVSPIISRAITEVPIEIPLDRIVTTTELKAYGGSETKVKVTVSGKKYIVDSLAAKDISVVANTDTITGSGTYTLDLVGKKNDTNADFSIVSVIPSAVSVELDSEVTKEFTPSINLVGATVGNAQNENQNLLLENDLVNTQHHTLTVTGPSKEIEKIMSAEAYAEVNKQLAESQQINARIRLFGEDGKLVYDPQLTESSLKNVQLSFSSTSIMANVYLQKTVPITISTKNTPLVQPPIAIYEVIDDTTSGAEVVTNIRIKGPPNKINAIQSVMLDKELDFSLITSASPETFTVNMSLPAYSDVIYSDYKNSEDVSFNVAVSNKSIASKAFNVPAENIKVNTQTSYTVTIQSALKGITVVGPSSQINKLDASNIYASVSVVEISAGTYVKNVSFSFTGSDQCWVYGSYQITLQLS